MRQVALLEISNFALFPHFLVLALIILRFQSVGIIAYKQMGQTALLLPLGDSYNEIVKKHVCQEDRSMSKRLRKQRQQRKKDRN